MLWSVKNINEIMFLKLKNLSLIKENLSLILEEYWIRISAEAS